MYKLNIVIPSTFGENSPADNVLVSQVRDYVSSELNRYFGGSTLLSDDGQWNNDSGLTVSEPVNVLFALTGESAFYFVDNVGMTLAGYIKRELCQSCVAYWIEPIVKFALV